jgi:hypothetical protein
LNHQASSSFNRAYVPIRRSGSGRHRLFSEKVVYKPQTAQAEYKENLAARYLKAIREKTERGLNSRDMLCMTMEKAKERIDVFYPQAWGMVSFLANSNDKDTTRILWDP